MVWSGPGQNLMNFQLKSNQKWRENGLGGLGQNLMNFELESNWKLKANGLERLGSVWDASGLRLTLEMLFEVDL